MENDIIESSADELLELLRNKKNINISEAADILDLKHRDLEVILSVLEERGIIMIKYPVIGEAQIVLKYDMPEKIKIRPQEIGDFRKIEPVMKVEKVKTKDKVIPEIKSDELNRRIDCIEERVSDLKNDVSESLFREDLAEILLIINGLRDFEKISFYLKEVLSLIFKMKEKGVWSKDDEEFTVTMLINMASNWEEHMEPQIAGLFTGVKKKIEAV
ncbi:MAG: hypothetical protein ABIF08_00595 [Nanoarchaeota archaeon]